MKMTNGVHTIETTEFLKNIWVRDGFAEVTEPEPTEETDEMTYAEMKSLAKSKGINTYGMKKEDIMEALEGGK